MKVITKSEIIKKANNWINNQYTEEEMMVLGGEMEEHDYCYSIPWCLKSEENLEWRSRTVWVGTGRLLVSKDGEMFDFAGSAPGINWVHHFELKIQGLEDYWYLEVPFKKENISKLKSAIKCSTSEILKMVEDNNMIIYTESKAWNDHFPEFQKIADDLNKSGIDCQVTIKKRKRAIDVT